MLRGWCDRPLNAVNGANVAVDADTDSELPAYQWFSADRLMVTTSGWSPPSIADLRATAKLKKNFGWSRRVGRVVTLAMQSFDLSVDR